LPLLIGLLLTPIGAWIGTILFFTGMMAITFRQPLGGHEWLGAIYIGTIVGSAFGAPVTVVALPAAYAVLRRKQKLALRPLMITGAMAGFISVAIVMSLFWGPQNLFADGGATALTLGIAADGAVTGAICGYLLGWITRSLTPDRWHAPAPPPA
jgi:membrane associated rhomboid family serine protease